MKIQGNKIMPDEGYTLTNGTVYSKLVYLGIHDSADNWNEILGGDVSEKSLEPDNGYTEEIA